MAHLLREYGKITKDQSRDSGMALVLLCLILYISFKRNGLLLGAIVVHVVNMTVPQIFRPFGVFWWSLSDLLGAVVSRVLMTIVFFVIVTPVGVLRRLAGKDALKLRIFRASDESVMLTRNHLFTGSDVERPY